MKRLVLFLILILVVFLVSCNNAQNDNDSGIYLNGEEEITIEAKSEYEELGIEVPNNYTYEISQDIDTNVLGKQEVTYTVYNEKRKIVKELKRTVNVVDTIAPTVIEANDKTFYLGVGYTISDFIDNYYDNFDNRRNLKISQTEFIFNELGEQDVEITISDLSDNATTISKTINVEFNIVKQLQYEYRLKPSVYEIQVSSDDDTGEQIEFIRVQLDMYREYIEGLSIYTGLLYYKRNNSEFGDYAKVRVNYDYYEKVVYPMYYEVWQDGKEVAIIYTPTTRDGNVIRLLKPSVNTNKTAYSLDEIANEAEHYIEDVIISCSEYVRNVLHFEVNEYEEIILYYSGS